MNYHDINAYLHELVFKAIMQPSIKLSAFLVHISTFIEWLCLWLMLSLGFERYTQHVHFQVMSDSVSCKSPVLQEVKEKNIWKIHQIDDNWLGDKGQLMMFHHCGMLKN